MVVVGVALAAAVAWQMWPRAQHLRVSGPTGQSIEIIRYPAVAERDCSSAPMPSSEVVAPPSHGTVVFRETHRTPPAPDETVPELCKQRDFGGKIVLYNPKPAFRGRDAFTFRVTLADKDPREVSVDVEVR